MVEKERNVLHEVGLLKNPKPRLYVFLLFLTPIEVNERIGHNPTIVNKLPVISYHRSFEIFHSRQAKATMLSTIRFRGNYTSLRTPLPCVQRECAHNSKRFTSTTQHSQTEEQTVQLEELEVEYKTTYHPYFYHLLLWASHADQPHYPIDKNAVVDLKEWRYNPAYEAATNAIFEEKEQRPFDHLLSCVECWLPLPFHKCFESYAVGTQQIVYGSSLQLLDQLNLLNQKTWNADLQSIRSWRKILDDQVASGVQKQLSFEEGAQVGFSVMHEYASYSVEQRTPICLYY